MSIRRKLVSCMNCGEERELAAHGLCFRCYRAEERAADNPWAAADRHNRGRLKAQRKLRTAITAILNATDGVIELMEEEHVAAIRAICGHYLGALVSGLPSMPTMTEKRVNSEHDESVNCSQEEAATEEAEDHAPGAIDDTEYLVNSEQEDEVNCSQASSGCGAVTAVGDVNSERIEDVHCSLELMDSEGAVEPGNMGTVGEAVNSEHASAESGSQLPSVQIDGDCHDDVCPESKPRRKRTFSAETRLRMANSARRRWANRRD